MKKVFFSLVSMVLFSGLSIAADAPQGAHDAEKMKKWEEYATPGAPHKVLEQLVGNWKYTSTWRETADGKPEVSTGKSSMKMILGKRWLQQTMTGKAMGQKFEGLGLTGYDNLKGKYETIWLDSMATGVALGEGTFDSATATLTDKGEMSCPMSPGKVKAFRGVWTIKDKKNMTYTMYTSDTNGKEFASGEMVFTR